MTDVVTKQPLKVVPDQVAGPYLDLPYSQLDDVQKVLDQAGVRYWWTERVVSWNGSPEMTGIEFGHQGNAAAVQAILDRHP